MKLRTLNEVIVPDYKDMVDSLFTDNPISSMALEPKEDMEDEIEKDLNVAKYGRRSNFIRTNTHGEDDVVVAKYSL